VYQIEAVSDCSDVSWHWQAHRLLSPRIPMTVVPVHSLCLPTIHLPDGSASTYVWSAIFGISLYDPLLLALLKD
jgi:hypothetical protein